MNFNKNKKLIQEREGMSEIKKHNSNSNISSIKGLNEKGKNAGIFSDYDNYTNLISQINNINTKYGNPSKISLSNKNTYETSIQNSKSNNNVINSINNFNPNLLHKSSKSISSCKNSISNNITFDKNKNNLKTVKNSSRISGAKNNFYKFEINSKVNNTSLYDFEIANKIGYETGRPSTHSGVIDTFSNNVNTTINSIARNNNSSRERINTLRNNSKRAKTPKITKIPARCFDNVTPLKYSNNNNENNEGNKKAKKIDYGINNYNSNLNNNKTLNNNNNLKKLYQKQTEGEIIDRSKTINNTYSNKSSTFTNYKKKK